MPLQRPPPLFTSLSSSCWITAELPEWLLFKPPVFLQCRLHAVSTQISKMHSSSYTFKSLRGPSTARRNRWPCGPSCSRALSCDPNALFRLLPDSAPACSLRLNQPDFYILPIDTLPRPHPRLACSHLYSELGVLSCSALYLCFLLCPSKHISRSGACSTRACSTLIVYWVQKSQPGRNRNASFQ